MKCIVHYFPFARILSFWISKKFPKIAWRAFKAARHIHFCLFFRFLPKIVWRREWVAKRHNLFNPNFGFLDEPHGSDEHPPDDVS